MYFLNLLNLCFEVLDFFSQCLVALLFVFKYFSRFVKLRIFLLDPMIVISQILHPHYLLLICHWLHLLIILELNLFKFLPHLPYFIIFDASAGRVLGSKTLYKLLNWLLKYRLFSLTLLFADLDCWLRCQHADTTSIRHFEWRGTPWVWRPQLATIAATSLFLSPQIILNGVQAEWMIITALLLAIIIVGRQLAAHILSTIIQIVNAHLIVHGWKICLQLLNLGLKQLLLIAIDFVFELYLVQMHRPQLFLSFALLLDLHLELLHPLIQVLVFLLQLFYQSNFFFKFAL